MKIRYTIGLCFLCGTMMLALVACSENLFGSSGSSDCGKDIGCLQISAEEMFRRGNYRASYEAYKKIVELDATASVGYFGMAKVGMWVWGVNPFTIIGLANVKEGQDFFVNDSIIGRNNQFYKAAQSMFFPLKELDHRDSLTAIWEIYSIYQKHGRDSAIAYAGNKVDYFDDVTDFFERLDSFGAEFCQGGTCKEGKNNFPLSDRKYRRGSYLVGYSISNMLYKVLSFMDINKDSCIITRNNNPGMINQTRGQWGCINISGSGYDIPFVFEKDADGNLTINLNEAYEELLLDPEAASDFNRNLEDLYNGFGDAALLISSIGGGDLWESGDNVLGNNPLNDVQNELNNQITEYQNYLLFYKLNDGIDNDGDGCIDEGLPGYDTDGDELGGEDIRLVSLRLGWTDCSGHTLAGSENGKTYNLKKCLKADKNYTLYKGADSLDMSGYAMYITPVPESSEDTIIKLKFADRNFNQSYRTIADIDQKLEVQMERTPEGNTKCYSLEDRKRVIGGCWVNYTSDEFRNYRLQMREKFPNRNTDCDGVL